MKQLDEPELRSVLVGILEAFTSFCDQEGLSYYLLGGTLLGAVRHNGFIPWDDDIDVGMPRPDYMKFYELTKNTDIDGIYKTYSHYNRKNYTFPFMKLCDMRTYAEGREKTLFEDLGASLDIFHIDGLPSSAKGIERHYRGIRFLRHISNYARLVYPLFTRLREEITLRGFVSAVRWFLSYSSAKLLGNRFVLRLIDRKARSNTYEQSSMVGVSVWGYGKCEAMEKDSFIQKKTGTFCNREYCIPAASETYLTHLYGDFMKLPPLEKQISDHDFITYWRNRKA